MSFTNPQHLVSTAWLAEHLADPALRVLDCTVFLRAPGPEAARQAYVQESGRAAWAAGHIPGSAFADLTTDLSDPEARLPFTMPSAERFAAAMSALGVGPGTRVVTYDANLSMWAARVWWMLRAMGFDDAAVLDGGWKKWAGEGRPVSAEPARYPAAAFVARPRPGLIASKDDVLAAIGEGGTCIVNALTEAQHTGASGATYGRAGHIASSVNVSARDLLDRESGAYLPPDVLRERFAAAGATAAGRVITYCGGGIAATSDALVLTLLGQENVAVYDGSLSEWARDPALPMETA
ncbi:MAG: sulfurtransferase [Dehalococcoidia bacterium]